MREHCGMAALASVIGRLLALIATPGWIRTRFKQYPRQLFEPGGGSLVQGSVASGLRHIYIRALLNQDARRLRIAAERNTGMQWLIAHRVVREAMHVRPMGKQESRCFGPAERGG